MVSTDDLLAVEGTFTRHLRAARAGSELTVWELLAACRGYLVHVAAERLNCSLRAKANPSDLVHETLLEAYRDFAQFRGRSEAEWLAWLRRLLIHNLGNFERRYFGTIMRCAHREVSLADRSVAEGVPAPAPSPSSTVIAGEREHALERGLAQLPDDYRLVLLWHHREGLPFDEIGARLGRSADAARRLWSRAVDRLQELLNPHGRTD
jgi:RNA polymerase sigma-70 factor, ECF subfamily